MLVQMRDISSVTPYADNPRINDAAVDAVAESLVQSQWRQPLVVDADGVIVVGHTRYKAAIKLGLTVVPVHVATDLTPAQAKGVPAGRQQNGRHRHVGRRQARRRVARAPGDGRGPRHDRVHGRRTRGPSEDGRTRARGRPGRRADPPADPVTRPGDVWVLGRHRLVCGDATDPTAYATLLAGASADLLLTDPPYNVTYEGKTADKLTIANDAMTAQDYRRFLVRSLSSAKGALRPGAAFYLWHADLEGLTVRAACADVGLHVRQCLIWVKSAFSLGRFDYHWKHESCLYGWADGAAHTWLSDRSQTTVLQFDRPAKNDVHPTMKPTALFAYLIRNSCPATRVVLDPFAGSGTTLVAAEQTGRTVCLLELDPRYCDVVVRRFEDLTGTAAERVPAGDAVPAAV